MPGLKDRLSSEPLLTAWSGIPDPLVVEILASQAFDAVTLDMQHGGHTEESVLRALPMITAQRRHALVRIPVGRFDMASRALDFGAEAVIAPMINSVAEAQAFAGAMNYPPIGERSWGPTFAMPRAGHKDPQSWLDGARDRTMAIAMIETRRAYEVLDEILAVPGIDAIFVGPADFSIAWTDGRQVSPLLEDMMATLGDIATRAKSAGKPCGIFVNDTSLCGRYREMGFNLLAFGTEHRCLSLGATQLLDGARKSLD